jgi:chaperonin GroEL (HSP60 family)
MRIETGICVGPALARSLDPLMRVLTACSAPRGRACLYEEGGRVTQAVTALDIVRQIAQTANGGGTAMRILRETLFDAERDLGDGGARLALLLTTLLREGVHLVATGIPAPALADALLALGPLFEEALASVSRPSADEPSLEAVAMSAGAPPTVAADITRLLMAAGSDGHAEIVASPEKSQRLETGSGFVFDAQPVAEIFATAEFDPVYLLVADDIIDDFGPLVPLLEGFATRGKSLLVVARDVTGTALQTLVRNHREAELRTAALKPLAVAQHAADILEDLAIATGATLIADRFGTSVQALRPSMLGRAARFTFAQGRALLESLAGEAADIVSRRRLLIAEAQRQKYLSLDRERLERRAARLSGRWARLHLGEADGRESEAGLLRARRALASARMALEGGAIEGGGIGMVRAFDRLSFGRMGGASAAEMAARRCLALGLADLVRAFAAHAAEAMERRGLARAGLSLGEALGIAPEAGNALLDPLPLVRSISRRALSGAATLLRVDAILGS